MPGFNQTGPNGQGPMTGQKMGRCTHFGANLKNQFVSEANENPNENNPENIQGRGLGYGRGFGYFKGCGMGRQNRFRGNL